MKPFFEKFPHYLPHPFDFRKIAEAGKLHTKESLIQDSGYVPYERWKKTVIATEGIEQLITQVEF
ncbi:MAG: hypothetical protein WC595_02440 [Candidatus Nanoarchaeia archaeon]